MENRVLKVGIQGYPGSFHDMAARTYWPDNALELVSADTFDILGLQLEGGQSDIAIMAIENSIAGSILQNYRILREKGFWVSGELYLRINHQLLGIKGTKLEDINQISSHPMALHQCRYLLDGYPNWKIIESEDTALSAKYVAIMNKKSRACIASEMAAKLYDLEIIQSNIENNKHNYTRFFIVNKNREHLLHEVNKASVYIRVPDKKGQLLKVLQVIDKHGLNMSKLQSYPVIGSFREYYFHLDIEFDHLSQYHGLKDELMDFTFQFDETGIYKRADISSILNDQKIPNTI